MDDPVSIGLAGLGALLFLIGLWAVWRLAFAAEAPQPSRLPLPPHPVPRLPETAGSAAAVAVADPVRRDRVVCMVARHDKVILSPIAGVYINLGKCFEDLGFTVQRASSLAELELQLRQGLPGVMGVDCRLGPRVLREVARLAPRYPGLRECVFLFYNAERPERLSPPSALPHAHFLGLAFASQQVMEILAPAFDFRDAAVDEEGADDGRAAEREKESGAVFEGKVSENSLPEILQFLEIGRRTGLLSLETDLPAGVINFHEGDIVSAQTHRQEGLEAVFEILSLRAGKFRFFPGRVTVRSATRLSATEVLLHWAQRMDETGEMVARSQY
jgi:hypothetical protein